MLFRVVLVMTTVFAVSSVNAKEFDAENKQAFELTPHSDVLYRPWSGPSARVVRENVPPPPPGPYLSSALSGVSSGFSGEASRETTVAQPSPLLRPDTPWPVKQDRPKRWAPEGEVTYAPDNAASLPEANRPYSANRMQPRMMYRPPRIPAYPNPPANFVRPQHNQQQMNQQRVQQLQERQRQMRQQQQQQEYQQRMNQNRMNQQQPMWNNFSIPMSNYPRPGQAARQPVQR